ncbi:MAG: YqiA/YcfP family alpha/beta fold hydrolase [Thermoanaerobaculia bacterium]
MPPTVIHLHGLGSSPGSDKAVALGERLRRLGVAYLVPDLETPSFELLTLTAVIDRVAELAVGLPPGPLALVGSSFGGLAAVHFVARHRLAAAARVERLVLLAPALDLLGDAERRRQRSELGDDWLARWRRDGYLDLPHSASGEQRPVHYGLVEDLRRYDSYSAKLELPILIYHGRRDESVPYEQSVRFAEDRPYVELRLLDTDHRLTGRLDAIGDGIIDFLEV